MAFWQIPPSSPLVAFRDLLADPLPAPNWLRGFWMPPYETMRKLIKVKYYIKIEHAFP